jgi:hypothetical protein
MIRLTEEMFATGKPFSQGEVNIWMKKYAPKALLERIGKIKFVELKLENDQMILGHSETGHHHVLEPVNKAVHISKAAQAMIDSTNDMMVDLKIMQDCQLIHMRGHDTHGGVIIPAGEYIRGIREEQFPEGWRKVQD